MQQLEHLVEGRRVGVASACRSGRAAAGRPGSGRARSSASRARIQLRLPRMVLISPLWAMYRNGWASGQDGKVLVENRECTSAIALATRSSVRSGIERRQLVGGQHSLVDDRAAGQRREVRVDAALAGLPLGLLAHAEHDPLQLEAGQRAPAGPSAAGSRCAARKTCRIRGIAASAVAPSPSGRSARRASRAPRRPRPAAYFSSTSTAAGRLRLVGRQERQAGRVRPGGRQREVHHGAEELVRHLDHDAGAVAGVRLGARGRRGGRAGTARRGRWPRLVGAPAVRCRPRTPPRTRRARTAGRTGPELVACGYGRPPGLLSSLVVSWSGRRRPWAVC